MNLSSKYFWYITLITFLSFSLRFEGLWTLDGPIFDEIFYPQYGLNYLQNVEFFYPHPPLANYLYSFSIWAYITVSSLFGLGGALVDFESLNPMSYRWLNALIGSLLFALTYRIAITIHNNRVFALLSSLFVAIDGAMIVDSRIATANMFLLFFGLCSMVVFSSYIYNNKKNQKNLMYFAFFIGLTASIKWNGLGFFLMASNYYTLLLLIKYFDKKRLAHKNLGSVLADNISLFNYSLYFLLLPIIIYIIVFIPDVLFNTQFTFIEKNQQMMGYHQTMVGENEHPYCSNWYTWPLMLRPIAYFFESYTIADSGISMIRNIHLFPNPILSLLSFISVIIMSISWLRLCLNWITKNLIDKEFFTFSFILSGYFCNLIPWIIVERCTFIYHYQPSAIFGFLALAWYLGKLLEAQQWTKRIASWLILLCIVIAFLYWLPIQLGIPMENFQFYDRMKLESWI